MSSRCEVIKKNMSQNFECAHLDVINESDAHNVPKGSETHIKIVLVSSSFEALNRVQRHRAVNALLEAELNSGLHALSLKLYTPTEWNQLNHQMLKSPDCQGSKS